MIYSWKRYIVLGQVVMLLTENIVYFSLMSIEGRIFESRAYLISLFIFSIGGLFWAIITKRRNDYRCHRQSRIQALETRMGKIEKIVETDSKE